MEVEVIVRIDRREVATIDRCISGEAIEIEEQTETLKDRIGQVVLEVGFLPLAANLRKPCCCGTFMESKGCRCVTIMSQSGEVTFERRRD